MKERPILFSDPMVRAILAGKKTQTRRVVKPQPPAGNWRYDGVGNVDSDDEDDKGCHWLEELSNTDEPSEHYLDIGLCPYGVPGDRLWVRETWAEFIAADYDTPSEYDVLGNGYLYRADGFFDDAIKWRPSIHMPRAASRITLEITGVRVERVKDISAEDARAEGMPEPYIASYTGYETEMCWQFHDLWDSLAKPGARWDDNPWVWVIEFRKAD